MESGDVKKALKEAKEAVKNKDYQTALDHCKVILKADKTSYLGWVLSAVSLQELGQSDRAYSAFKKATDLQPAQLTAWQGLTAFLEQERGKVATDDDAKKALEEKTVKLQECYSKLLDLYKEDIPKQVNLLKKQSTLYATCHEWESCAHSANRLLELDSDKESLTLIVDLLFQQEVLSDASCQIVEVVLEKLINATPDNSLQLYKKLLRVKLTQKQYSECGMIAGKILDIDADDTDALEVLCQMFVVDPSCSIDADRVDRAAEKVLSASANNLFGNLAKGALMLRANSLTEARNRLQRTALKHEKCLPCLELLCEVYCRLRQWSKVEEVSTVGLELVSSLKWKELLLRALLGQETDDKLQRASEFCAGLTEEELESPVLGALHARCLLSRGNTDKAERLTEGLDKTKFTADLAFLTIALLLRKGGEQEVLSFIEQVSSNLSSEVDFCILAASTLWKMQNYKESAEYFLKALKLNGFLKEPYFYLGLFYGRIESSNQQHVRGLQCLQKALQLDPACTSTALALSDAFVRMDDVAGHQKLLEFVTASFNAKEVKWAWLRKGLLHLQQARDCTRDVDKEKLASEAVSCFQNALRVDPADRCCWEALGDGYNTRGSFSSALKAYQKALSLDETSVYATYQIAVVLQRLGETREAICKFKELLAKTPDYVPALKGLAETLLGEAKDHQETGFTGRLMDCCSEALDLLVKAARIKPNLTSLWALMGQSCLLLAPLPESHFSLDVPLILFSSEASEAATRATKAQVMELGKHSYIKALQLSPECSHLWHNLALCYQACAKTCPPKEEEANLAAALNAAKKAVTLAPECEGHWNLLGTIAQGLGHFAIAQHAFIRAVEINGKSAAAWANLGVLYLKHDELHLANEALKKSQNADPFYVRAWIGQASIAEKLSPGEAMDLFRHTVSIGTGSYGETEGSVAYAQWVVSTLLDPALKNTAHYRYSLLQMHATVTAIDALVKYVAVFPDDACAQNLLGLLYERQKLYRNAEAAFAKAKQLLGGSTSAKEELQKVQANLARIYTVTERPDLATELYASLQDSELSTACGVALAHFKAGRFAEAFVTYQATLDWLAPDDAIRSHLHVALASCAFRRDCRQAEAATTLLFQSCQMQPPSVYGLLALASLGLLTEDPTLTEAAFQEIMPYVTEVRYASDIAFLFAYYQFVSADAWAALKELARSCHILPTLPKLWMQMATFLGSSAISASQSWKADPSDGEKVARYAEIAAEIARRTGSSDDNEAPGLSQVEALIAMGYLIAGDDRKSIVAAQKAVHCCPDSAAPWSVLLAAGCSSWKKSKSLDQTKILWLKRLIGHLRRNCDVAAYSGLAPWLGGYEKRLTSLLGAA